MKTIIRSFILLSFFAWVIAACSKSSGGSGGGGTPPPAAEENLVIALNPDPGSTTTPVRSTSATYSINVVIQSKLPPLGVEVKWTYKKDSDGSIISQSTTPIVGTASPIAITITNLPLNEVGTVEIEVTSRSKATNKATKTFKLVRK